MLDAGRRKWRLFYLRRAELFGAILVLAGSGFAQSPALTTISDTVYRADGSAAAGTLLISWPAFTTADGATIAAGNNSVVLGAGGSFTTQLAPNSGATPAGTLYTVVYQLTDGTVKTENWLVGTTSPETISAVRTTTGTAIPASQAATQQYVNAQLATVVHLSGNETITGAKQFTSPVKASSFTSTGTGAWMSQTGFGNLSPSATDQSSIGFGSGGQLEVSENGGPVLEVAKLDTGGNVPTAVALAQTPTQCTGSFATGIQADGNANCSTADQIQLAETSAPTGIPNYGIFWFDSTCHCAKAIDNAGQAIQLGLTNVFNQDSNGTNPSNTLEEVNGANPQAFRVYRAWTNATDWERTALTWDQSDGYFVIKNENLGADYSTQHGIGFWIGSGIRWGIDTASNFKPFVDNLYSVGSTTLRPATGYFGTAVYTPALLLQGSANTSGGPVNLTGQTAAVSTTNLLSGATVGEYAINIYLESDATCSSPGSASVSVTIGWGDRTGARSMTVPLQGSGVSSGAVALGSLANFGEAAMTIWNNSASNNLTYSTSYTACTTGTGTYALYITYRRVQ